MRTYRRAWRLVVAAMVLTAVAGTVVAMRLDLILAIVFTMVLFGGVMGYAFKDDLPEVRHPVLGAAALFTAPALYPGLSQFLGAAAAAVVAVLVLTSPFVVARAGKRLRPRLLPPQVELAALAGPDEALRRQWTESTRQLDRAATLQDQLLIVRIREQILDDVVDRTGGQLPDYVWETRNGRGGDHPTVRSPYPH